MKTRSYRPKLVTLESREQPGSVLTQGLDLSALASTLLGGSLIAPAVADGSALAQAATSLGNGTSTSVAALDPAALNAPPVQTLPADLGSAVVQQGLGTDLLPIGSASAAGALGVSLEDGLGDDSGSDPLVASSTLWYSGDADGVNGLANEVNTLVRDARVYDDFTISDPHGWHVKTVFTHNLMGFVDRPGDGTIRTDGTHDGADFEIRTGVSAGNGGTLVASGHNRPVTQTFTGNDYFGFIEFVSAINVNLELAPGTYWLSVTPVGHGTGRSFNSTTSGANGVGSPINGQSFFNSADFSANFVSAASVLMQSSADFSMGVIGKVNRR